MPTATLRDLVTLIHKQPGKSAAWYAKKLGVTEARAAAALEKLAEDGIIDTTPKSCCG